MYLIYQQQEMSTIENFIMLIIVLNYSFACVYVNNIILFIPDILKPTEKITWLLKK